MRSYWLAAAVIAGVAGATPATAQRVWQDGRWVVMPRHSGPTVMRTNPHRWAMRDGLGGVAASHIAKVRIEGTITEDEELLKRHPEAFADHAARFFLKQGDAQRAGERRGA